MAALTEIPNGDYYDDVPNRSDLSSSLLHLELRPPCLSAPRLASLLADRIVGGNGLMDATKIYGRGSLISQMVFSLYLDGFRGQVEVNENPPDPLGVGASKDVLDVFWMDDMITWLPKKGLVRAKLKGRAFWKSKTFILKSMNISGEGRFMAGLKSTSNG
ncbi:hypothetical protein F2Q70_00040598 [Brassica cretica]|uniref:Uncharacterized protein n=1 Tax=Brassica cretica TaxID=69181 RepID=A0A8S9K617_BRACR|nr:hypothetical protein F2Q70_00040598 [Brassica cretica]